MNHPRTLARVLIGLLVASAILFWIGSSAERLGESNGPPVVGGRAAPVAVGTQPPPAAEEGSEEAEQAERAPQPTIGSPAAGQLETRAGVDLEAPAFRVGAVVLSLALALALWRLPSARWLALLAATFAAAFAVLDARELLFHLARGRAAIAASAGGLVLLHAGAATLAILLLRTTRRFGVATARMIER